MAIEMSPDYNVLQEKLTPEFLTMTDYSVSLYLDGVILQRGDDVVVVDFNGIDMASLDLDAVRWWIGLISLDDYLNSIDEFYKRRVRQ